MLIVLAHGGAVSGAHDLWTAWPLHPSIVVALAAAAWAYARGARRGTSRSPWQTAAFVAGLVTLAAALLSPLDPLSSQLASAHMVQHVLLALLAPPLLVAASAGRRVAWGTPAAARRLLVRGQRRLGLTPARLRSMHRPSVAWLLTVGALWFWHASVPYEAAVDSGVIHALEHGSFFATGLLFWGCVLGTGSTAASAAVTSDGYGVLLLFAMAVQSTLLAALLTFAGSPWYDVYASTTGAWGLDPLLDQQVAGVIMWVPAGLIYPAAALLLLVRCLHRLDQQAAAGTGPAGGGYSSSSSPSPTRPPSPSSPSRPPSPSSPSISPPTAGASTMPSPSPSSSEQAPPTRSPAASRAGISRRVRELADMVPPDGGWGTRRVPRWCDGKRRLPIDPRPQR